jgi:Uma2 family endonuclease
MALQAVIPVLSEQDYLDLEAHSQVRHEYVEGYIFAMSGTTKAHNQIALNLATLIRPHLRGTRCRVYMAEVKTRIQRKQIYYYPDVMVGCDPTDRQSEYYLDRPCLLIEVLSESTKHFDKREKLLAYQTLGSVQEYVIVSQTEPLVEVHRRNEQGQWYVDTYKTMAEKIYFRCIELQVTMQDIYEDV